MPRTHELCSFIRTALASQERATAVEGTVEGEEHQHTHTHNEGRNKNVKMHEHVLKASLKGRAEFWYNVVGNGCF